MARKRRKKKMKFTTWFKNLSTKKKVALIAIAVILILLIIAVVYVASLFGKLDTEVIEDEEIFINEDLDETVGEGYTNFVLFGGDSRQGNVTGSLNTDSIIIASLNNETKEVKLVSVYRDTLMDMTDGNIRKCNAAYSLGGAKQAINMLNMNLDLDIRKYVTVDFGAVAELVDMLGGVEVDVSEAEMNAMNKYIAETARVAGKEAHKITAPGLQVLDGVQATTYARIRKGVGDDFARTERQRLIIQKVVEKALKADWSTINNIINKLFPRIATNFTLTEIISYGKSFTKYSIGETSGFPFDKGAGTIPGKGSCVYPLTLESNVQQLHEFLYGSSEYQPSSKVVSISDEIAYIVGNSQTDSYDNSYSTTTPGDGTTTPDDGTTTPDDGTTTPDDGTTTPDDGTTTPDDGTTTPDDGTTTPGDSTTTPDDGTTTPGDGETTPGDGTTTPDGGETTPGDGTTTPDDGTTTPGDSTTTPDDGSTTPTDGTTDSGSTAL